MWSEGHRVQYVPIRKQIQYCGIMVVEGQTVWSISIKNAGLQLLVHPWIIYGIDDRNYSFGIFCPVFERVRRMYICFPLYFVEHSTVFQC